MDQHSFIDNLNSWRKGVGVGPYKITLFLTDNCNLKCRACSLTPLVNRDSQQYELSEEKLVSLVDEGRSIGVKQWDFGGGGEPLMRRDVFLEIALKIKAYSMIGSLTTNGTLFTHSLIEELVKAKWDSLHISLDGPDAAVNDSLRPPIGTFDKAVNALCQFNELKRKFKLGTPLIYIHYVISALNYDRIVDMVNFAHSHTVDGIEFDFVLNRTSLCEPLIVDRKSEILKEQVDSAKRIADAYGIDNNLSELLGMLVENTTTGYRQIQSEGPPEIITADWLKVRCYSPWYHMIILTNGMVMPCCLVTPLPDNLKESTLEQVWFGDNFSRFRNELLHGHLTAACRECNATLSAETNNIRGLLKNAI